MRGHLATPGGKGVGMKLPSCEANIDCSLFLFRDTNLILVLDRSRVIVKFNVDLCDFYLLVAVGHWAILMV